LNFVLWVSIMRSTRSIKKAGRRGRRGFLLPVVIILAVTAVGWWGGSKAWRAGTEWLASTSWALLDRIEVRGLMRLPEHDILTAAAVSEGANLMHLDLDSIASRVMELPGVKKADVFMRLPGRLVIRVEERAPIAGIGVGRLLLVDDEGAIFQPEFGGEVLDVPIITGDLKPEGSDPGLKAALKLICDIRTNYPEIYGQLGEINCRDGKLALRLRPAGALVRTDAPTDSRLLRNLQLFLQQKGAELSAATEYIDLRYPAMVITGTRG